MFSIKILNLIKFLILAYLKSVPSQHTIQRTEVQPKISISSLTGAYRPAEIQLNFTIKTRNYQCKNPLAKYMVSIRKSETEDNFGYTHFCGGVIIQTNLILTAAHCFIRNKQIMSPSALRIVAKTPLRLNKTPKTQIIRVGKIIIHDLFSIHTHEFDIALLKLREHIILDNNCASVIALPKYNVNTSTPCAVLGWGKLFLHGPMANEILQLNVTLHSKDFCGILFSDIGNAKICASDIMDYEKNPCSGDSGGPLICEGYLTGLVSFGFQCGYGLPTVYTEVYEYMSWIKKNNTAELIFWIDIYELVLVFMILAEFVY